MAIEPGLINDVSGNFVVSIAQSAAMLCHLYSFDDVSPSLVSFDLSTLGFAI